jgi:hypothetical protein
MIAPMYGKQSRRNLGCLPGMGFLGDDSGDCCAVDTEGNSGIDTGTDTVMLSTEQQTELDSLPPVTVTPSSSPVSLSAPPPDISIDYSALSPTQAAQLDSLPLLPDGSVNTEGLTPAQQATLDSLPTSPTPGSAAATATPLIPLAAPPSTSSGQSLLQALTGGGGGSSIGGGSGKSSTPSVPTQAASNSQAQALIAQAAALYAQAKAYAAAGDAADAASYTAQANALLAQANAVLANAGLPQITGSYATPAVATAASSGLSSSLSWLSDETLLTGTPNGVVLIIGGGLVYLASSLLGKKKKRR